MSPKKTVKKSVNNEKGKQQRRPKKAKALLKKPSIIKVKIQPKKLKNACIDQNFYKDPIVSKEETKINLTNEVIKLQFNKVTANKGPLGETIIENGKETLKKPISRKSKITNEDISKNTVQRKAVISKKKPVIKGKQVVRSKEKKPVSKGGRSRITPKKFADTNNDILVQSDHILNEHSDDANIDQNILKDLIVSKNEINEKPLGKTVYENIKKPLKKSISGKSKVTDEGICKNTIKEETGISKKKSVIKRKQDVRAVENKTVRKGGRTRTTPKKFADTNIDMLMKNECNQNDQSDDVPAVPQKKVSAMPVKLRRTRNSKNVLVTDENINTENFSPAPMPRLIAKRKLSYNCKVAKAGPESGQKLNDVTIEKQSANVSKETTVTYEKTETSGNSKPNALSERRNSYDSNYSDMSWIRNISSSSATTLISVSSDDLISIDNKIPILKLTHLDKNLRNDQSENDVDRSSLGARNKSTTSQARTSASSSTDDSTSSSCTGSTQTSNTTNCSSCINKTLTTLEKLSLSLSKFDANSLQIGNDSKSTCTIAKECDVKKTQNRIFESNVLKEEKELLLLCQELEKNFPFNRPETDETDSPQKNNDNVELQEGNTLPRSDQFESIFRPYKSCNDFAEAYIDYNEQPCEYREKIAGETPKVTNNNTLEKNTMDINDNNTNSDYYDDNDDDDALSLFAESITGIDSFRSNNSFTNASQKIPTFEEYVPQPLSKDILNTSELVYQPTKIIKSIVNTNKISPNICEKQNADSTSAHRTQFMSSQENVTYEDRVGHYPEKSLSIQTNDSNPITSGPRLMASIHTPFRPVKRAVIFKGYCFYYLLSSCQNHTCRYRHILLDPEELKERLSKLSEDLFIQEYMYMRPRNVYRRRYGVCFVVESIRRELTRILVEMAIDFTRFADISTEDNIIRVEATECILLYLNRVELNTCDDLLKYKFNSVKSKTLCEIFMDTMAVSHNFQRFKSVFVKLTQFMHENGMSFSLDVANSILERVCILPFDERLSWALITIMQNTDKSIYCNSKVGDLEKLLAVNRDLCDELRALKEQALANEPIQCNVFPYNDDDRLDNNTVNNVDTDVRYSPDTTKSDNVTKPSVEIVFKRTIDLNKLRKYNFSCVRNPSANQCDEVNKPKSIYSRWKNQSIFDRALRHQDTSMFAGRLSMKKRRSNQIFGGSPNKFRRISGPSNF